MKLRYKIAIFFFRLGRIDPIGQGNTALSPFHGYVFHPEDGGITLPRTVDNIAHFYVVHKQQNKISKNNESP